METLTYLLLIDPIDSTHAHLSDRPTPSVKSAQPVKSAVPAKPNGINDLTPVAWMML